MAIELSDTFDTPVAQGAPVAPGAPGSAGGDALVAPGSAGGNDNLDTLPGTSEKTISLDELSGVLGEPVVSNVDLTVIEVIPKKMSEHVKSCWGMLMGDLA